MTSQVVLVEKLFQWKNVILLKIQKSQEICQWYLVNLNGYEHLIRNRIGIKPHLGSVIFETTLRYNKKRSISQTQELKPQKIINKERTILPKVLKDTFIEIQEKNINKFIHCLKEEGQGTIRAAQVEWITSLKSDRKKKKKK